MDLYIQKLRAEFMEVLKNPEPEAIRKFFKPTRGFGRPSVKCVLWGHHFMPKYV